MGNRLGIYWVCSFALAIALLMAPASANTNMITYQGVLSDAGAPFTGAADMGFSLWNAASGGTQVWGVESVAGVQVSDGVFAVLLGATVPFGATFADNDQLWLEVQANMGSGMQTFAPRVPFTAAPFAFRATTADVAESVEWTNVQNIPAGFADNTDDVDGGAAASVPWAGISGVPADLADGDDVDGGAAASVPWAGILGVPADLADGDDVDGGAAATVPWAGILGVPADLADGDDVDGGAAASVPWAGISGVPAGFADGMDNIDGGVAAAVAWTGVSGKPAGFADGVDDIDGGNAEFLDGLTSSDFSSAGHAHSSLAAADGSPANSLVVNNDGNVGIGTATPNTSALVDIASTTQGFAMPRMTSAQRKAVLSPLIGLQVFDTNLNGFYYWTGSKWDCVSTPAGSVTYFAGSTAPAGYLECNGQAVSRTTFAELFSAIGTTHGAGDGSTTFNVPDLRGEFVRGWDHGRGVDSGRGLGSLQAQDWKSFYMQNAGPGAYNHGPLQITKTIYPTMNGNVFGGAWSAPAGMIAFGWDSSEIRPRNRALMGCIKF